MPTIDLTFSTINYVDTGKGPVVPDGLIARLTFPLVQFKLLSCGHMGFAEQPKAFTKTLLPFLKNRCDEDLISFI